MNLILALADDKLVLGHRNSEWTGLAPILEEDIAFSSLAQDEMAHAAALYELLAPRLATTADALAFGRSAAAYRCASIVEVPDEFDWATALARQFYCDHFDRLRLERLGRSSDADVAALCRRLCAEEQVHVDHVDGWIVRLGRGTDESKARVQKAITALAPHASMLFEPIEGQEKLESSGMYPPLASGGDMFDAWARALQAITDSAGLRLGLSRPLAGTPGGRRGRHSEHLQGLLDEMCEVYRLAPGAAW